MKPVWFVAFVLSVPIAFALDRASPQNPARAEAQADASAEAEWARSLCGSMPGSSLMVVKATKDGGYILAAGLDGVRRLEKLNARGEIVEIGASWSPPEDLPWLRFVHACSDGGYLIAGHESGMAKLDSTGRQDSQWGNGAWLFLGEHRIMSIDETFDRDGNPTGCVATGWSLLSDKPEGLVIKLDLQGRLDASWASNPFPMPEMGGLNVQQTSDGKYVVLGSVIDADISTTLAVARIADGVYDRSWSVNPVYCCADAHHDSNTSIAEALDREGNPTGYVLQYVNGIKKLDLGGNLIPAWGPQAGLLNGITVYGLIRPRSGGYVLVGIGFSSTQPSCSAFAVTKLDENGSLDPAWRRNPMFYPAGGISVAVSVDEKLDDHGNPDGYVVAGPAHQAFVACDCTCAYLIRVPRIPENRHFLRGNSNDDCRVDLSDAVFTLDFLFLGGPAPTCVDAADADDSGIVNIGDPIYTLNHLFFGGPKLPDPYPTPALDVTGDALPCDFPPGS